MKHDNVRRQECGEKGEVNSQGVALLQESCRSLEQVRKRRVGRPAEVSWTQLCVSILLCILQGWNVQRDVWRMVCTGIAGLFAPVAVCDQAIYNRLARAAWPMRRLFEQVSTQLYSSLSPWQDRRLAPFAHQVLALDECTLDQVARWLPSLRQLAKGDAKLLAGRLSALFDVRMQQWVRVELFSEAKANCKAYAQQMLTGLQAGTLLLFDRGYFSFPWFDQLTEAGLWWISRYANKATFRVKHILYQGDEVLDAIVQLGINHSDQARHVVRLVRYWYQGEQYCYLTNVLDPHQLSVQQIVDLYARRWEIEMAFRLLKDYLQLNELWSAKWSVVQVQVWSGLLLAQLFHAVSLQVAVQAGVEPFDVSMELLVRWTPRLLHQHINPIGYLVQWGRELGVIRPCTRRRLEVPWIDPAWLTPAPPHVLRPREQVRHSHRKCGPRPKAKK